MSPPRARPGSEEDEEATAWRARTPRPPETACLGTQLQMQHGGNQIDAHPEGFRDLLIFGLTKKYPNVKEVIKIHK